MSGTENTSIVEEVSLELPEDQIELKQEKKPVYYECSDDYSTFDTGDIS